MFWSKMAVASFGWHFVSQNVLGTRKRGERWMIGPDLSAVQHEQDIPASWSNQSHLSLFCMARQRAFLPKPADQIQLNSYYC